MRVVHFAFHPESDKIVDGVAVYKVENKTHGIFFLPYILGLSQ